MGILEPKLVMLDTGTIVHAVASPNNPQVKELWRILRSSAWIPYVTWHQLEELLAHENNDQMQRRLEFLESLPHVAYLKCPGESAGFGSSLHVRDHEIAFLADDPKSSHETVVQAVSPKVRSGFSDGIQFVKENRESWAFFRAFCSEEHRRSQEEIANVTHFPTTDIKQRLPERGKSPPPCSAKESGRRFARLAEKLHNQIIAHGDSRKVDPKAAALSLMREAYEESLPLLKEPDFVDALLKRDGVLRDRLPDNPTFEDLGYEAIFVAQMKVHARRLMRNKEDLVRLVRKEQVPGWLIWQEVDRRLKQIPNAEIGNVNDKHMLSFGPYLDAINVDKRMAELLRQSAHLCPLLRDVHSRVPIRSGLAGLLEHLSKH